MNHYCSDIMLGETYIRNKKLVLINYLRWRWYQHLLLKIMKLLYHVLFQLIFWF